MDAEDLARELDSLIERTQCRHVLSTVAIHLEYVVSGMVDCLTYAPNGDVLAVGEAWFLSRWRFRHRAGFFICSWLLTLNFSENINNFLPGCPAELQCTGRILKTLQTVLRLLLVLLGCRGFVDV